MEQLTKEEILEQVRALPTRERLEIVERVVHEVAQATSAAPSEVDAPWADMDDQEFQDFLDDIERTRREQPLRASG